MAKAKLTTRAISTTTVTSDNLAKASQLTHNQLDSNFINLRDATFGVVADDSATIQVGMDSNLYIQGGDNVTTSTDSAGVVTINASGGDSLGDLTAVGSTISSPSNAAITLDPSGTGTIELNANTNVTGNLTTSGSLITDGLTIADADIKGTRSNENIIIDPNGSGKIVIGSNLDVNQNDITSADDHWIRIQPDGDGVTQIKNLALSEYSGEGGISSVRFNLDFDTNHLKLYRTNVLLGGGGAPSYVYSPGTIFGGEFNTTYAMTPSSLGTEYFKFDRYGMSAYDVNGLTMLLSGATRSGDTSSDSNVLQLYFKKVDMPDHNVTFTIGNEGNLVFQANAGTPHITLYENADDGKIEIMPKAGKEVFIDGIQVIDNSITPYNSNQALELGGSGTGGVIIGDTILIHDNTISTNISNANLELSANSSGIVHVNDSLKIGTGATVTTILDEDAMGSDSATALATQQSIKKYIDDSAGAGFRIFGDDSAGVDIPEGGSLYLQGGDNVTTTTNSDGTITINAAAESQSVFKTISVSGQDDVVADTTTDTLTLAAGSNITITTTAGSDTITFASGGGDTGDITFVGSTIISPSNADLTLNPAGTGKVNINAVYTLPNADGSANQVLGTNGSGVLSFRDPTAINIDGGVADSDYSSVPTIDGGTA